MLYSNITVIKDVCFTTKCVGVRFRRNSVLVPLNKQKTRKLTVIFTHKPGSSQSKTNSLMEISGQTCVLKMLTKLLIQVLTEKYVQCDSCEFSFIWELTEDYCPGDSLSDSSQEVLRRGRKGGQYVILAKEVCTIKQTSQQKFAVFAPYCVPGSLKSSGFPKSAENARGLVGLPEVFLCNTGVWQRDLLLFFFHSLVKSPPLCVGRIYDFLLTNRFWQRWAITAAITQHYNTMHAIISLELFLMSILQF